ncbi:MAG: A/G-specific adenine glycosylase [Kiritimatiellae bacterium]|nr:A/G-specific adenine glycosylase [Kiritimatiellia bacterium]
MTASATGNGTSSSKGIARRLLAWYQPESRAMPWRGSPDPYAVWISEIMLQQTQVQTVRGYFLRFMERFPTVQSLAEAPEADLLKQWEGLGYYTRARNLHRAAKRIVADGGAMPASFEGWAVLPGIGPYTAASISSICLGLATPVVDGNVIRVFSRYRMWDLDFRKPVHRAELAAWLQPAIEASRRPGDFNQAMMDLGATCCTPKHPACDRCPLASGCEARKNGVQEAYPVKPAKKPLPTREVWAFLVRRPTGEVLFRHREGETLLGSLWELPNTPVQEAATTAALKAAFRAATGGTARTLTPLQTLTHVFSHFRLLFHVYTVTGATRLTRLPSHLAFAEPAALPLTTVTRRALHLPH